MQGLKRIISTGLLIFVVFSLVYLAVGKQKTGTTAAVANSENGNVCGEGKQCTGVDPVELPSDGSITVAYYFHRTARCRTCRALESAAKEAIKSTFADDLAGGALSVRSINVEEPGNHNFIEHYGITGPSLVLSRMEQGKEVSWKNLDKIWNLIRTPAEYKAYVVSELESIMKAQS
jgi:hypothetical protein